MSRFGWILWLCWPLAAAEPPADKPVAACDFEDRLPGQAPAGWQLTYGSQEDELFQLSNLRHLSGRNSLLLDRASGQTYAATKFSLPLPDLSRGYAELELGFLIEGSQANLTLEVGGVHPRQAVKVVLGLRGQGPNIHLYPNFSENWSENWAKKILLGQYQEQVWYRLRLFLPVDNSLPPVAYGLVERRDPAGEWHREGRVGTVPCQPDWSRRPCLSICAAKGTAGFKFFFDDLKWAAWPQLPDFLQSAEAAAGD